jgi:tRNA dimethylallyltransferase
VRRGGVEVVAIFGPTASGKTAVAERLADALGTEVVSADAMQVYRGLPILTNQPARATRLVAIRGLAEEMSVGEYAPLAHAAIDELIAVRGAAVVAGGTGLYLRAALAELGLPPAPAPGARARWEAAYDADPDAAYALLGERDPAAVLLVHRNDRRRVVRALELAEIGSSLAPDRDTLWSASARHPSLVVGLEVPTEELGRRIRERAESMFERGVLEEVREAIDAGPVSRTAEKVLGLREIVELPPADAKERLILGTRRLAAYQRKWMRRVPGIVLVDGTRPAGDIAEEIGRRASPSSAGEAK